MGFKMAWSFFTCWREQRRRCDCDMNDKVGHILFLSEKKVQHLPSFLFKSRLGVFFWIKDVLVFRNPPPPKKKTQLIPDETTQGHRAEERGVWENCNVSMHLKQTPILSLAVFHSKCHPTQRLWPGFSVWCTVWSNYMRALILAYLFICFEVPKFFQEGAFWRKLERLQEIQQAEQLLHWVLQRGSCQQNLVFLLETCRNKTWNITQNLLLLITFIPTELKMILWGLLKQAFLWERKRDRGKRTCTNKGVQVWKVGGCE